MEEAQLKELLLQSLEHERGAIPIYETALACVLKEDLKQHFQGYLDQTRQHEQALITVCREMGLDSEEGSPGRHITRQLAAALIRAIHSAQAAGNASAAELVACECVLLAETRDRMHWELIGQCARHAHGRLGRALKAAAEQVQPQKEEHLSHSRGWVRQLWLLSLGLPAVLPPPEQREHPGSAIASSAPAG